MLCAYTGPLSGVGGEPRAAPIEYATRVYLSHAEIAVPSIAATLSTGPLRFVRRKSGAAISASRTWPFALPSCYMRDCTSSTSLFQMLHLWDAIKFDDEQLPAPSACCRPCQHRCALRRPWPIVLCWAPCPPPMLAKRTTTSFPSLCDAIRWDDEQLPCVSPFL